MSIATASALLVRSRRGGDGQLTDTEPGTPGLPLGRGLLRGDVRYAGSLAEQDTPLGRGRLAGTVAYRGRLRDRGRLVGRVVYDGDLRATARLRGIVRYTGDLSTGVPAPSYAWRRTLVVAKQDLSLGRLTDPILRNLHLSGEWLKTSPAGKLRHTLGYDLIVQASDGTTQLAHDLRHYDATAGTMRLNVRMPAYDPGAADQRLVLRYGDATVSAATDRPGTVWTHALAAWIPFGTTTGDDRSGQGRTLALTSVTNATLARNDAGGSFAAGSSAKLINPSFLAGPTAFTLEFRMKPAAPLPTGASTVKLIFRVGVATPGGSPGQEAQLFVAFVPTATVGATTVTNTLRVRAKWGGSVSTVHGPSSCVVGDEEAVWNIVWQSGQTTRLYKNGVLLTDGLTEGGTPSGALAINSTDELTFGHASGFGATAGVPTANNGLPMVLGDPVLYPRAMPPANDLANQEPAWIARMLSADDTVVGLSAEDAITATNLGAVAVPMRLDAPNGTAVTASVRAAGVDPESGTLTMTAPTADADVVVGGVKRGRAVANVTAGTIVFTREAAAAGVAGEARVAFSLRDSQAGKVSSSVVVFTGGTEPEDEVEGGTGDFAGHNGTMLAGGLTVNSVTYQVPAFMKGWERDTAWSTGDDPPEGIRFRCPTSQRQFRFGQFNSGNNLQGYCNAAPTFHGANMIGYGQDARDAGWGPTDTWAKIAGGAQAPTDTDPLTYSTPSGNVPNNLNNHVNFGYFNLRRATVAMGIYMSTLPFETATPADVTNAIAAYNAGDNNVHKWWKAFFSRLKQESNRYGNPVLILRPNWEGMNQDTGLKLAAGSWFNAGYNITQYNKMMRNFCRAGREFGPVNMYIVFSPAFETTAQGPGTPYPSYEDWLTDDTSMETVGGVTRPKGGPGGTNAGAWVGYTGTCASIHPDSRPPRATTETQAKSLISGGGNLTAKFYPAKGALDATVKFKIPFFSLEIGPSTAYSGRPDLHDVEPHGPKFYGDTFIELGQIINRANMYGLIGAFGFLDSGSNLFPTNPDATQSGVNVSFWNNQDRENMLRCARAVRKYWGKKSDYANDTVPDYSTRTD